MKKKIETSTLSKKNRPVLTVGEDEKKYCHVIALIWNDRTDSRSQKDKRQIIVIFIQMSFGFNGDLQLLHERIWSPWSDDDRRLRRQHQHRR